MVQVGYIFTQKKTSHNKESCILFASFESCSVYFKYYTTKFLASCQPKYPLSSKTNLPQINTTVSPKEIDGIAIRLELATNSEIEDFKPKLSKLTNAKSLWFINKLTNQEKPFCDELLPFEEK